jgi:hypothetical protein
MKQLKLYIGKAMLKRKDRNGLAVRVTGLTQRPEVPIQALVKIRETVGFDCTLSSHGLSVIGIGLLPKIARSQPAPGF